MPLNDLSLDQLSDLQKSISVLTLVGKGLEESGFSPRFNLSPGERMIITVDAIMPEDKYTQFNQDIAEERDLVLQRLADLEATIAANGLHLLPTALYVPTPSPEVAPREPALDPVDAPLVPGEVTEGAPISAESQSRPDDVAPPPPGAPETSQQAAASDGAEAESGGGQAPAAAAPPAATAATPEPAPIPGSASALAATAGKTLWTEEEDALLVAGVTEAVVRLGVTKDQAIKAMATTLGRPAPGTEFRANRKLKDRINAAIAAGRAAKAEAEEMLAKSPATEPAGTAQGDAAVGAPTPAAVQDEPDMEPGQRAAEIAVHAAASIEGQLAEAPVKAWNKREHIADPVTAHLMGLTDKGGWTVDRDLELVELSIAGWQTNEIALQLQMQANAIKPRFDALTGLFEDPATGKKVRRFKREDVFAALQRLAGKAA